MLLINYLSINFEWEAFLLVHNNAINNFNLLKINIHNDKNFKLKEYKNHNKTFS